MKPPMLHTAYKITTARNAYGDFDGTEETEYKCHFREISEEVSLSNNQTIQSDAMAWFEPDADINKKDILKIYNTFYRVEKLILARSLRNPSVQFIKTDLLKYGRIS
jgi:hypothetical protein